MYIHDFVEVHLSDPMEYLQNYDGEIDEVEHCVGEEETQLLGVLSRPIDVDEAEQAVEHSDGRPENDSLVFTDVVVVFDAIGDMHQQYEFVKSDQEAEDQKSVDTLVAERVVVAEL